MIVKGAIAKESFWKKCLLFITLSLFGLVLSVSIATAIQTKDASIFQLQITQFFFAIFSLILPALAISFLLNKDPFHYLHLKKISEGKFFVLAIFIILSVQPFINLIGIWNEQMHLPETFANLETSMRQMQDLSEKMTLRLLSGNTTIDLLANLLFLALIPAISEELFFRGALQRLLEEKTGKHIAIWLAAIIFSAFHMQFFGFIPRVFLGAMLGYLLVYSRSIYIPIIAHFSNNAMIVLFVFFVPNKEEYMDLDKVGTDNQWWLSIFSLFITLAILYVFYQNYITSKKKCTFVSYQKS